MVYRDMTKTVFGDLQHAPVEIYRVNTESSTYFVSLHEERGRTYVLVRGQAGSDREAVVVRDSDPRIGDRSLFEVPPAEWIGQALDVATMRTSPIHSVTRMGPGVPTIPDPAGVHVAPPPGMSDQPAIVPVPGRGTHAGDAAGFARQVVVPAPQTLPYPMRHVRYFEDIVTLLRSIHRRDRLFDDCANDPAMRDRLGRALVSAEQLLAEIRRRVK